MTAIIFALRQADDDIRPHPRARIVLNTNSGFVFVAFTQSGCSSTRASTTSPQFPLRLIVPFSGRARVCADAPCAICARCCCKLRNSRASVCRSRFAKKRPPEPRGENCPAAHAAASAGYSGFAGFVRLRDDYCVRGLRFARFSNCSLKTLFAADHLTDFVFRVLPESLQTGRDFTQIGFQRGG